MKHTFLVLFLFCGSISLQAQSGSLDLTFGSSNTGTVSFWATTPSGLNDIALQSDGDMVKAGYLNSNFDIAINFPSGAQGAGYVSVDFSGGTDVANCLAILSDDKMFVAGYTQNSTNKDMALVKLNANASVDNTFSGDGRITIDLGSNIDEVTDIMVQADGKIVLAGIYFNSTTFDREAVVIRLDANGNFDNTFDGDGIFKDALIDGVYDKCYLDINSSGNIYIAGTSYAGGGIGIAKLNTDGTLDVSFDTDGKMVVFVSTERSGLGDIKIQPDGKILLGGWKGTSTTSSDFVIFRLNSDGSTDNSFDVDGQTTYNFAVDYEAIYSLALQADNKIIAAGYTITGGDEDFALIRVNPDGSLDNSFDNDGATSVRNATTRDRAYGLAIQTDGKIVLGGDMNIAASSDYGKALMRFNNDVTTGIADAKDTKVIVFPNPSDGKLTVESDEVVEEIIVEDLLGRKEVFYSTIEITTKMRGMILLSIKTRQNMYRKKMVIN